MANTLTNVLPVIFAQGLQALRQNAITTRLVTRSYDSLAADKGDTINIPIPSAIAAATVVPGVSPTTGTDFAPTKVQVTMDFWVESSFAMTDKDQNDALNGVFPMQATEAIKSVANAVDAYVLGVHRKFYGAAGTPGTTPFATVIAPAGSARRLLNKQLAPMDSRRAILDPDAESNLLQITNVLQFDQRGDQQGIIEGSIGRKLGFDWYMNQNVTTYTPGGGWVTGFVLSTVGAAVGDTTVNILNATASGTIKMGDLFTVNGGAQQYVVTASTTVSATAQVAIAFYPALLTAAATGAAITVVATAYIPNIAFHPLAIAWVSRPLTDQGIGNQIMSEVDPISGIALRLEVSRQNKQTKWSFDILGGANVVRREYGTKIFG